MIILITTSPPYVASQLPFLASFSVYSVGQIPVFSSSDFRPALSRSFVGLVGTLLFLVSLALTGCSPRETNVDRGTRDQVLHRGIGSSPGDLDPHLATSVTDYHVLSALFEGLVGEDPRDLSPAPGVAERWDVSPDDLTYTFHLRADARWSNGDPVTATDFLRSWQRVLTPSFAADYANLLYIVQNAEAYHAGRETDFTAVGFAAPDSRTVRITLEYPAPYFLSLLQHWMWFPVHLDSIAALGPTARRGTAWARHGTLISNGPFTLTRWDSGQRLIVEKSPTYWDAVTVRLNAIHFYPIDSVEAEERAFRSGQLHLTDAMPVSKIDTYRENDPHLIRIDPYLGTYFFRFNTARPFLNDPQVRQALTFAVDRTAIVETILRGAQLPAVAYVPPDTGGYTPAHLPPADFDTARARLAAAGYPGGEGAPSVELLFNTSENHRLIAEAVQEMWRRELGLTVTLVNMEFRTTLDARRTGAYQILRSAWIGDYADPASFLDVFRGNSGNNYTSWSSTAYDQLLFAADRTADPARRHALLREAETILLNEAPILPLYHYTQVYLIHPAVRGWRSNLLARHPYKHVWLEPAD